MNNNLLMFAVGFFVLGLLFFQSNQSQPSNITNNNIIIRCIDGVKYILFKESSGNAGYGFLSVKFNRDGMVETCDN